MNHTYLITQNTMLHVAGLKRTKNMLLSRNMPLSTLNPYFFAQRVLRYCNSLPLIVKASESVTGFKSRLDAFRLSGYRANKLGHHWELSYDIFDRIDVTVAHRSNYVNYMKDNPIIAKRKKVNLKGLI